MAKIQQLMNKLCLDSWEVVLSKLECLWWVEKIHAKLCKTVFEEVMVLNSVLIGYPVECALH